MTGGTAAVTVSAPMIQIESFVAGRWLAGDGESRAVHDPTTERELGAVRQAGIDFASVLRHAREVGSPALRRQGFRGRAALLKALSALIHDHRDELLDLSTENGGNTRSDGKFDVDGASGTLAAYAKLGEELPEGNLLLDGDAAQLGRTPRFSGQHVLTPRLGVALHINAFNFPVWGMGEKMAQALLAGVPVIEKPGTASALVAHRLARIIADSGILPEGSFQFVAGSVASMLDELTAQDSVAFTGSSATAAAIRGNANLVRRNVRVTIEADSVNAAILGPDVEADSDTFGQFLANIVTDVTQKAGQKCTAVRRILVPQAALRAVEEALIEALTAVCVGDPREPRTRMGPVASRAQFATVREGIDRLAGAAEILCGGSQPAREKGWFLAPTLLRARDPAAPVLHQEEVFGPCATLFPYDGTADAAASLANLGGGGLVASLYTDDRAFLEPLVRAIAPWHGRVWIGSEKTLGQALGPGAVLPQSVHGGPGRAGGGEELGGLRGLALYLQRTALQGDRSVLARSFG
ncbi:MAG: hypothetical protein Fur0037_14510 [Planctomycetota bacterium]